MLAHPSVYSARAFALAGSGPFGVWRRHARAVVCSRVAAADRRGPQSARELPRCTAILILAVGLAVRSARGDARSDWCVLSRSALHGTCVVPSLDSRPSRDSHSQGGDQAFSYGGQQFNVSGRVDLWSLHHPGRTSPLVARSRSGIGRQPSIRASSSHAVAAAVGTTDLRRRTTSDGVGTWTRSDSTRTLVGAGWGSTSSLLGPLRYLEGTDSIGCVAPATTSSGAAPERRSPGSDTLRRSSFLLIRRRYSFRKRIAEDELLTFAAATVFGDRLRGQDFGVVLEAPFGRCRSWWAAGRLLALAPPARRRPILRARRPTTTAARRPASSEAGRRPACCAARTTYARGRRGIGRRPR